MRTLFSSRQHDRQIASRRRASRRDFLRLERLENRYALSGAAPGAVNDLYHAIVDQPLEVAAPAGILANDTDAESDPLAAGMFSEPAHGTVTLNEDGSFQYTPEAGFVGLDSFIYFASDGTGDSLLAAVTIRVEEPSVAPVAANDAYTTAEDSPLTVDSTGGILANDSDADGDAMTPTVTSQPQHGTLAMNADGSFSYTPEANFSGLDGFSYFVNDGGLDSDVASVTLTVTTVNDSPTAVNDELITAEDTPLEVAPPGVLGNDSDVDGDALSAALVAAPQHGTVTLNTDGSLLYTPDADFNGIDGFSYLAGDGSAESDVASVTITVTPTADAPVGTADSYTLDEDAVLTVDAAGGVLANDTDVDGDALSAALVTGTANGTLTLNADGSFSYSPTANFSGSDSFVYTAGDGALVSGPTTVSITINPTNDAPAAANDEYTTAEDTLLEIAAPGLLGNDSDPEGDPLTVSIMASPIHGTVTLNADGSFSYTPNADFNGVDGFSYLTSDGTLTSEAASVTINVTSANDGPMGVADSYTTDEDTPLAVDAVGGLLANDTDVDGDPLTAALDSGPANGTLTLNADGSFNYTPNSDFNGSDSFTYTVSDGTLSSIATASITVNAVNDAPVATDDALAVNEDETLTLAAPGIMANDSDPEGDPLTAALVAGPASGTLTMNADGSLSYTPNADFNGSDSFTYTVGDGTLTSNVATVAIAVAAVNDGPSGVADSYTTDEDTALTVDAIGGLLANDTDPDGDPLTAALDIGPANGTLTLNADGSFNYTPNSDFSGSDSFTYSVSDGTLSSIATASITVNAVNDAPVATDDALSVNEDETLTLAAPGIMANDSDPDGDPLTAALVAGPASGTLTVNADGSLSYTPTAGFSGSDSFTYTVSDGTLTSNVATVAITVAAVNDSPIGVADSYTTDADTPLAVDAAGGLLANDTDPDGDPLTAAVDIGPANGTLVLNADGSFNYSPNSGFTGSDSFTYSVSDGTLSSIATASIAVTGANDAPVATDDQLNVNVDETLTLAAPGIMGNDSDPNGDPLTATLVTGPASGTLTLNADGSLSYTPNAGYMGSDSFTYTVSDGVLTSNTATASIMICHVSDHLTAAADAWSTDEDTPLTVAAPGVLANDSDPEGDALTATIVTGPANGTVAMSADGSFLYTPNASFSGSDTFVYAASDGTNSAEATVTITVNPQADSPTAAMDNYNTGEDIPITIGADLGVLANDLDPSGSGLTAEVVDGPTHGTLTLNSDGSFSYTPEANWNGTDSFTYKAISGGGEIVSQANIIVEPLNDLPVAANDEFSLSPTGEIIDVDEDGTEVGAAAVPTSVMANDSDIDSVSMTATLVEGPEHGTLVLAADGTFTYVAEEGYEGDDTFRYQISDGMANSNVATVTLHVAGPSQAPLPPAAVDDVFTMTAGDVLEVSPPGVLENDTGAEGEELTSEVVTGPEHGTVALDANGGFIYTPEAGFVGSDTFTYQAVGTAGPSNVATVSITIEAAANTRPEAINDSFWMTEGATLEITADLGLLLNDSDPEGSALIASLFSGPLHGSLTMNDDGSFSYTPNEGFTGLDSFLYRVSDGELFSALGAVTIHVNPLATDEEPAPIPEPEPGNCLAMNDELLDQIMAEGEDPAAIDELMSKEDFLA